MKDFEKASIRTKQEKMFIIQKAVFMKSTKFFGLASIIFLINVAAQADTLALSCEDTQSYSTCASQIEHAFAKVGCHIDTADTHCANFLKEDPRNPNGPAIRTDEIYCEVSSDNCSKPKLGLFGGESCFSSAHPISLEKSDGVHNGYFFGFAGAYSRKICILN